MHAFAALADPIRASIVETLAQGDLSAGEIAARFPVARPAVSRHLSVLLRTRLVIVRKVAQRRFYSLDPDGFDQIETWTKRIREKWNDRLDALERHLDTMAAKKTRKDSKI